MLSILDDLAPVFEVLRLREDGWERTTFTGLPEFGVVAVWPLDGGNPRATATCSPTRKTR